MKGIMRKKLLALLSAAGLAGTATSAVGQEQKGSQPSNKTKAESSMKYGKAHQENGAATNGVSHKERKAGREQQAAQDVVNEKVGPDHVAHKHLAGVKYEDAASKDAAKMTKAKNEKTAAANAAAYKEHKAGAGRRGYSNNGRGQDAITVKQKVSGSSAGMGGPQILQGRKAGGSQQEDAATTGKAKFEKNAAESDASKKAATIKLTKGAAGANAAQSPATKKTDQASPGKKMDQASPK